MSETTTINPGLFFGISDAEYRAIPAMSQSELKAFMRDPELYYHQWIACDIAIPPRTASMQLGCDIEDWLLTRTCGDVVVIPDDVLSASGSRSGGKWKTWSAENQDKRQLKQHEWDSLAAQLAAITKNVEAHKQAAQLITKPWDRHPVVIWENDHGFLCKAQLDLLKNIDSRRFAVDIKSADNASPKAFERKIEAYGYEVQAAWYMEGLAAVGHACDQFIFIVVEASVDAKPTANKVETIALSEEYLELGRKKIDTALTRYRECQESSQWHSRTWGQIAVLSPSRWAESNWEAWEQSESV